MVKPIQSILINASYDDYLLSLDNKVFRIYSFNNRFFVNGLIGEANTDHEIFLREASAFDINLLSRNNKHYARVIKTNKKNNLIVIELSLANEITYVEDLAITFDRLTDDTKKTFSGTDSEGNDFVVAAYVEENKDDSFMIIDYKKREQ